MSQQIPVIFGVSSDTMDFMENTRENEFRLYQLKWQAFLVNIAYEILGEGFYAVHPHKSKAETRKLEPRECFGILKGYSVNGAFTREQFSRWRSAMNSDDLEEAAKAIKQSITYLQECEEKIAPSASVWWESSSDETQFFRESSGGRSDKY